jgi:hypothetical protein
VARERRVVTPYGYVWFVRRRWARRRLAEDDLGELFLNSLVGLLLTWIAVPWLAPLVAPATGRCSGSPSRWSCWSW